MKELVVILHGLGRTNKAMDKIDRAIRFAGFETLNFNYPSTEKSITEIAEILNNELEKFGSDTQFNFVTHSLGGLVTRRLFKLYPQYDNGKVVMIAPPNKGSAYARQIINNTVSHFTGPAGEELKDGDHLAEICAIPKKFMIIVGTECTTIKNPNSLMSKIEEPCDGTITKKESKLDGMEKIVEVYDTHTTIMNNGIVIGETIGYLQNKDDSIYQLLLEKIYEDRSIIKKGNLTTIGWKTSNKNVLWVDLANYKGWKIQQNKAFRNCRIIDENEKVVAFGVETKFLSMFQYID